MNNLNEAEKQAKRQKQAEIAEYIRKGRIEGRQAQSAYFWSHLCHPVEITVGRVTVAVNVAGNSRVDHPRATFRIDGKRASRKAAYAL